MSRFNVSFEEAILHFSHRHWMILFFLTLIIAILLSLYAFNPELAIWDDNAEFVILAQSVSQGKGFTLINFPHPIPNKRYPPGFPLLLVPTILLCGTDIVLLKITIVVTYIVSMVTVFLILRQLVATWFAFLITLAVSSNFILLNFSCQLMAEIPYLCFSMLTLWCYLSFEKAEPGKRRMLLFLCFTVCSLCSFYIKSIGIALVAALLVSLILEKKYKEAFIYIGLCVMLYLPWFVRDVTIGGGVYIKQFLLVNPYDSSDKKLEWIDFWSRVQYNFSRYFLFHLPAILWPGLIKKTQWFVLLCLNGIAFTMFFITEWHKRRYLIGSYAVFSFLILLAWPQIWTIPRMLIPLIPIIFVVYGVVFNELLSKINNRNILGVAMAILCIASLFCSAMHWKYTKEKHYGFKDQSYATFYELCGWIKTNVRDDIVINSRKPFLTYLLSGKKTTRYSSSNPDTFYTLLKENKVTHLIVSHLPLPGQKEYFDLVIKKSDKFVPLHKTKEPTQYFFKVLY